MNFERLEGCRRAWRELTVIGKSLEHCHIIGMTLGEGVLLHLLEPPRWKPEDGGYRGGIWTQRRRLKEQERDQGCRLDYTEVRLGETRLRVGSASAGTLEDAGESVPLFWEMMKAGWSAPSWMREVEWDELRLVTLELDGADRLPEYAPGMPVGLIHEPLPRAHLLEKTVTLQVGKSRTLSFQDSHGERVWCHINRVFLIDVWESLEERWADAARTGRFSAAELEQARRDCAPALGRSCPGGMRYVGLEYECSRDLSLQFYTKDYLRSRPEASGGISLAMTLKPEQAVGAHGLPLRGEVLQTAVPPDTVRIPAELFCCYETAEVWEEKG